MAEKEYIEREAVLMLCQDYIDSHEDGSWRWVNAVTDKDIMNIPSADVAPVRHGEWANEETAVTCTACGRSYDTDFEIKRNVIMNFKYCPKCGARMDGGEGE